MKTRNGKIARLPKEIREEINRRIQNGQTAETILRWLNKLPECRKTMDELFDGRPVSKQNLSEWKQGGYEDWLRKEEACVRVHAMMEQAEELAGEEEGPSIADRLATVLEMQLMEMTNQLEEITDAEQRWQRTREILKELHRLRREDHNARRMRIIEEKREVERELEELEEDQKDEEEEAFQKKQAKKWLDLFWAHHDRARDVSLLGGGEYGWKWADWMMRMDLGLPMPDWWEKHPKFEFPPGPNSKSKVQGPTSKIENGGTSDEEAAGEAPNSQAQSTREDTRANVQPGNGKNGSNGTHATNMTNVGESEPVKPSQSESGLNSESKVHPPSSDFGATGGSISKVGYGDENGPPASGQDPSGAD